MARPTLNDQIDSILYGDLSWGLDTLTYFFDNSYDNWTTTAKTAFRAALETWSDVADIDFRETFIIGNANLIETYVDDAEMTAFLGSGVFGAHEVPFYDDYDDWLQGWYNWESFNWPGQNGFSAAGLQPGGIGFSVFVHELGHALGLAHPHDADSLTVRMPGVSIDSDLGQHDLNQGVFTVMSYNDGWTGQDPWGKGINDMGYNSGPGAFDIAAIQYLYGAQTSHNNGATIYRITGDMGWSSIWDTGGTDKIVYVGSDHAVIDLRSAPLDEGPNAGGFLSFVKGNDNFGGFTIAGDFTNAIGNEGSESGVIIENATGGSGNDRIVGNAVANVLRGMGGNDKISAGNGRDKILGGNGRDTASGGGGNDKVYGEGGNDTLDGNNGNDQLFGGNGDDVLKGAVGGDVLNGGKGKDLLRGGSGDDRFVFKKGYGLDKVLDFKWWDDSLTFDDALWAGTAGINTAQDVIDEFAFVNAGGHVVFKFDNGDRLMLIDVDAITKLEDSIFIV